MGPSENRMSPESLKFLASLEDGRILFVFLQSGGCLESPTSLESFKERPFLKRPFMGKEHNRRKQTR